jgi:hypothetical protein
VYEESVLKSDISSSLSVLFFRVGILDFQPKMGLGAEGSTGAIQLKWDAKDLEIRTRSVEMALQPLVMKVNCSEDLMI